MITVFLKFKHHTIHVYLFLGYSQPQEGQTECIICAAGTIANAIGQADCTPCLPGSFQALTGETFCEQCAIGKYAANPGSTSCTDCAAGVFHVCVSKTTHISLLRQ